MTTGGEPREPFGSDEGHVRRFAASRDAGDREGARRWWAHLVEDNADRVRGLVALWGRGGRLSADEQEDAVSLAFDKLWRTMVESFRGDSMGEWVNATKQCVHFACSDVQRAAARRSQHERPLDEPAGEDEDGGRYDWRIAQVASEDQHRAAEQADAREFVRWGLERMTNERRRLVLERTLDGAPAEEIAVELGVAIENLYQLRSRGLRDLRMLHDRYEEASRS